jgi:hypothetical protein
MSVFVVTVDLPCDIAHVETGHPAAGPHQPRPCNPVKVLVYRIRQRQFKLSICFRRSRDIWLELDLSSHILGVIDLDVTFSVMFF